ncbi:MAG: MBL fold metallo-hydrolase [Candidatus Woesearchaeota archaeon]
MAKTAAIASGSNGNCYFLESGGDSVLVDAGISCKELNLRMEQMKLKLSRIGGVFITHEHSDHIRGLETLAKRFEVPIYLTEGTLKAKMLKLNDRLINIVRDGSKIGIGNIKVNAFSKSHDAAEPCSYMLHSGKFNVSVMTDIGKVCSNVVDNIKNSDVAFLESNYDENMLMNGRYPYFLKNRITGERGHISNYQAALAVMQHATKRLKHVFLSHLSGNNNTPELALNTFNSIIKERRDFKINAILSSRDSHSQIVELE